LLRRWPEETTSPRRDTRDPELWQQRGDGRREAVLFDARWERVVMLRLARGYAGGREVLPRGGEFFVVEGDLMIEGISRPAVRQQHFAGQRWRRATILQDRAPRLRRDA
jgi:hypothetical protein